MKRIPLSRGLYALVDDEDYAFLSQWKWCASTKTAKWVYAVRSFRTPSGKRKTILMHRQILGLLDAGQSVYSDHVNGNTLDNRKENLRITMSLFGEAVRFEELER